MKIQSFLSLVANTILCFALVSCNEEMCDQYVNDNNITIDIVENTNGFTRAVYTGFPATTFEVGDAIGVYAFDGTDYVSNNVKFTKVTAYGNWEGEEKVPYNASYTYYAYYPYSEDTYTPSVSGTVDDIDTKFASFIEDNSGYFWKTDQSTKANFTYSNLMIAKGNFPYSNNQIRFNMMHKRSLAVFCGRNVNDVTFTTNVPYIIDNKLYFLMKPNTSTSFTNNYGACTLCVDAGEYKTVNMLNMEEEEPVITGYLKFVAVEDGTFKFNKAGLSYSLDDGTTWTELPANTNTPTVTAGSSILWKCTGNITINSSGMGTFSATGLFDAEGNIMSINPNASKLVNYNFNALFANNKKVRKTENLILPSTTLAQYCYQQMFINCTELTTAPALPATTMASSCYQVMFSGCTGLTTAPALPATTLAPYCYSGMFYNCTNLTTAPELSATSLKKHCYRGMFQGCTGLTTAPALPATTLAENCYNSMFSGCKGLTTAPALPATSLTQYCYYQMFSGCKGLTTAPALPATTLAQYCYQQMFINCTGLTTAPELSATSLKKHCYRGMFQGCTGLTTAPALPATTLAENCYNSMFSGCKGLTTAPALPATSLTQYCYYQMFYGCTGLTTAPALPATSLATSCYQQMFQNSTGLTTAPALPATSLATNCYQGMFQNCTGLTTAAPSLPATSLASNCYRAMYYSCAGLTSIPSDYLPAMTMKAGCYAQMFYGCTSLTTAPALPATTMASSCYRGMFFNCTGLTTAPALPATILDYACYHQMFQGCTGLTAAPELPAIDAFYNSYGQMFYNCSALNYIKVALKGDYSYVCSNWISGVSPTGTFYQNENATWSISGNSGRPSGWTVVTYTP